MTDSSIKKADFLIKLREMREELRHEWRSIREEKLRRRDELLASGKTVAEVRNDRVYRMLTKKQRKRTVRLAHVDKKISRHLSLYPEKK